MTPVGFECVHCRHRLSVHTDRTGEAVRCPNCQATAVPATPAFDPPDPDDLIRTPLAIGPDASRSPGKASEMDSIFSDADEDESLFGGLSEVRKPILPAALADAPPPTLRVPGIAHPKPSADAKTAVERYPGMPTVAVAPPVAPAEGTNPFRRMVDEVMTEAEAQDAADREELDLEPDAVTDAPVRPSRWLASAFVGLSLYAAAATVAAVWGWTRAPAEKPPVQAPKK